MDIIIAKANTEDAEVCCKLAYCALKEYAGELTLSDDKKTTLERLILFFNHKLTTSVHKSNFIVAKAKGKIVGSCTCYKGSLTIFYNNNVPKINQSLNVNPAKLKAQQEVMLYTREAEDNEYYLDTLSVDENFQGLGISKKLINAAKVKAKNEGFNKIVIVVNQSHLFAFYEKLGFKKYKKVSLCGIDYIKMKIEF